ncbi:hypothetical protein AB0G06_26770 [Nonomuraea dietziae]|uniref:hypothetical protein n=1 Tax=Nonomuraea dietziae TaxID=65515 RepID=UPI0034015087
MAAPLDREVRGRELSTGHVRLPDRPPVPRAATAPALVKSAAAWTNVELGVLSAELGQAVMTAVPEGADGGGERPVVGGGCGIMTRWQAKIWIDWPSSSATGSGYARAGRVPAAGSRER